MHACVHCSEVIAVGPVFVRPEAGGQGIGKAITAALLNKQQERQWKSLRLVQVRTSLYGFCDFLLFARV
jgi:predicted N-acetyltransferase YhbS